MPNAVKNQEIESLTERFGRKPCAVFADFTGLPVADMTVLRRKLRAAGGEAVVVKNTLVRIAASKALKDAPAEDQKKLADLLTGPNLMVLSFNDPVASAKVLSDFAKGRTNFALKGGWLDGAFMSKGDVERLSSMPSREEILGKLLSLLNTPATQLLRVMQAPGAQLVRLLEAHRAQIEKKAA